MRTRRDISDADRAAIGRQLEGDHAVLARTHDLPTPQQLRDHAERSKVAVDAALRGMGLRPGRKQ